MMAETRFEFSIRFRRSLSCSSALFSSLLWLELLSVQEGQHTGQRPEVSIDLFNFQILVNPTLDKNDQHAGSQRQNQQPSGSVIFAAVGAHDQTANGIPQEAQYQQARNAQLDQRFEHLALCGNRLLGHGAESSRAGDAQSAAPQRVIAPGSQPQVPGTQT